MMIHGKMWGDAHLDLGLNEEWPVVDHNKVAPVDFDGGQTEAEPIDLLVEVGCPRGACRLRHKAALVEGHLPLHVDVDVARLLGDPFKLGALKVRVKDVTLAAAVKGRHAHQEGKRLRLRLPRRLEARRGVQAHDVTVRDPVGALLRYAVVPLHGPQRALHAAARRRGEARARDGDRSGEDGEGAAQRLHVERAHMELAHAARQRVRHGSEHRKVATAAAKSDGVQLEVCWAEVGEGLCTCSVRRLLKKRCEATPPAATAARAHRKGREVAHRQPMPWLCCAPSTRELRVQE